jgi:hypothetical protein
VQHREFLLISWVSPQLLKPARDRQGPRPVRTVSTVKRVVVLVIGGHYPIIVLWILFIGRRGVIPISIEEDASCAKRFDRPMLG